MRGALHARDRIDDGRVRVRGERGEHAHAGFGLRIAAVDHAQRRFAARDQHQRGAHVLGLRHARFDRRPRAQRRERRLRVLAGGHAGGQRERDAPIAEQRAQVHAALERHAADPGGRWRDQHQRVAQQVAARGGVEQAALLQVVHPVKVRGHEQVRRCALFDLPGQRGTGGVRHAHALPGGGFVRGGGFVERFLHARRGEHADRRACRHDR